jgi:hypothetical protein
MRWLAVPLMALSLSAPAGAQGFFMPSDYLTPEQIAEFRLCRAAALLHSEAPDSEGSVVPRDVAEALKDQINFVMAETILNKPIASIDDAQKVLEFTEGFLLDFTRTIGGEIERLRDIEERERILMQCMPLMWYSARSLIDYLMAWRAKAIDAPPLPEPNSVPLE